ncbi:MAG TPA: tetratricopeptide repeat protein, partial [Epsilonproteobacteria bacterium]|nr:tetratricopeptide repeat protein [Campylobacterota bacterium]
MFDSTKNTVTGNQNSIITIVNEALGKEAQEHIVKRISTELTTYLSQIDQKLVENQNVIASLSLTIQESVKTNQSLTKLLDDKERQRAIDLAEIQKLKQEQINSNDIDFKKVIQEAEKALENYDSDTYQEVLEAYRKNKKHKELVQNIATTHYLSAKNYAGDFYFEKAKKEISKAIVLDETNGDYAGWYGFILLHLAEYKEALKYLEQSLEIRQEIGDKSGERTTLNNISQIYKARGDYT